MDSVEPMPTTLDENCGYPADLIAELASLIGTRTLLFIVLAHALVLLAGSFDPQTMKRSEVTSVAREANGTASSLLPPVGSQ